MTLINNKHYQREKKNKVTLQLEVYESVNNELQEYLKWADMEDQDHFIEEACKYIFENDDNWKKFKEDNFETIDHNLTDKEETEADITNQMVCDDEGMTNLEEDEHNLGNELQKKK